MTPGPNLGPLSAVPLPTVLPYAFSLGLVAGANPCGLPLLPAYLAAPLGRRAGTGTLQRTLDALAGGGLVTLGFVGVFGALGLVLRGAEALVLSSVPWVMVPLALLTVVYGVLAAGGRPLRLGLRAPRARARGRALGMVVFGVAYAVASLSCALPVFLAGVAGTFTRADLAQGVASFIAYALGMGALMTAVSLVMAFAGTAAVRGAVRWSRWGPRVGGAVLALVGAYLALYWVGELTNPLSAPAPVRAVDGFEATLVTWLSRSSGALGLAVGAVTAGALVLAGLKSWRSVPGPQPVEAAGTGGAGAAAQGGGTGA